MKEKVLELMQLALEYNAPDFAVFVDFMGHTNSINFYTYPGGWKEGVMPVIHSAYLDRDWAPTVDGLIQLLKDTHAKHRAEAA